MGRADEFFGIGAGLVLEPLGEIVGQPAQRAALRRHLPLPLFQRAFPDCASIFPDHLVLLFAISRSEAQTAPESTPVAAHRVP